MSDLKENRPNRVPTVGIRHLQVLLLFSNVVIIFINRLHTSVSIVAMTNAAQTNPNFPEHDWNEQQKSYILSSVYWSYTFMQLPAGYLTRKFGVKINLFVCTLSVGVFSLLTPFCVPWGGWKIYCALRIAQGTVQGCFFPCFMQHLAKWSPPNERSRFGGFAYSGFTVGTILSLVLPGLIAASPLGWPGIFYISAALCFVWCALWLVFGANDASTSTFIKADEQNYIEMSLKQSSDDIKPKIPIPWRAILSSPPFYALMVSRCTQAWGYHTILAELPTYMSAVLELNIKENALYSALPYLICWLMTYVYIFSSDFVLKRKWLSLKVTRKGINSLATWLPAAGLISYGFFGASQYHLAVILMCVIVGINSGNVVSTSLGVIDLAPNLAGILAAIVNTCVNVVLMLALLLVGFILTDEHDRGQWRIVFALSAAAFCVGDIVFFIFGSVENQPWNAPDFLQFNHEENISKQKEVNTEVSPEPDSQNNVTVLENGKNLGKENVA